MEASVVPIPDLLVPIVLSAFAVFLVSFLLWGVLPWHKGDWKFLDREDVLMNALRDLGLSRGQYTWPQAATRPPKSWSEDEARKVRDGPLGSIVLWGKGPVSMGKSLALWFVYLLIISWVIAYVAGRTLTPGAEYLAVFRVTATVGVLAYAGARPSDSIFFFHSWSSTFKNIIDGVIYGFLTAGFFSWLWPAI
jgi:hypothetical protein